MRADMKRTMILRHMLTAINYSKESYCERRKVGCLIVKDGTPISQGYNGTLPGEENVCELPTGDSKPGVIHAEQNALSKITRSTFSSEGASVFLTLTPCVRCATDLYMAGIKELYYLDKYRDPEGINLLISKNIHVEQLTREELLSLDRE